MIRITEIQMTLTSDKIRERDGVLAFVRLVFDGCFAVRDIKVMERDGKIYLGMPSRKVTEPCDKCGRKVGVTNIHCHNCGQKLPPTLAEEKKIYVDIAYPINQEFRSELEEKVLLHYNNLVDPDKRLKKRS